MAKKKDNNLNNTPYTPRTSGSGARAIQSVGDARNISPREAAAFAQQNPGLIQDLDVTTTSAAGLNTSLNRQVPKDAVDQILGIIDEFDPYSIPADEEIENHSEVDNTLSTSARDPELKKALANYGKYFQNTTATTNTSSNEVDKLFNNGLEKVYATPSLKVAQIKKMELELQGFSIQIDKDFNGDFILYKEPTELSAVDQSRFVNVGSGIYLDKEYNVWNLNTTSEGKKYLVRFGSITDAVATQYPENYSLVKDLTQSANEYQFSGTDLHILNNTEFFTKLGIEWIDQKKYTAKLTTYDSVDLKNLFYNHAINISLTPIFKVT